MKKNSWIGAGVVLLLAGIIMVSQKKAQTASGTPSVESDHGEALASTTADKNVERTSLSAHDRDGRAEMPAPQLSQPVKALLGLDGKKHNYPSLLAAIDGLGDQISSDDLTALMAMLDFPNDQFPEKMRPIEINAVKNDVLDKLLRQAELPEGLGLQMVEMAGNADNDPVWRDYCVQFMQPFYERAFEELATKNTKNNEEENSVNSVSSSKAGGEKNELAAVHDAMFQALDERDSTIAGTSLIGLELLSRTHDEFDRDMIVSKSAEIASDETASAASRMTALRLAAGLTTENTEGSRSTNYDETVEAARSLAQTGETVLLRSAAIVTLGEVGSAEDRELLESYAVAENRQIAAAAKMALEKMDTR